jgi:hypothetical protein
MSMPAEDRRKNPAPMTIDQMTWVAEQTEHAVRKTARKVVLSALVGYVILFAGTLGVYHNGQATSSNEQKAIIQSGNVVAVDGCNRDFQDQQRWINLLERLRDASVASYKDGRVDEERYQQALEFYSGEIALANKAVPDCRKSEHILTDDPDADRQRVRPLYPKSEDG